MNKTVLFMFAIALFSNGCEVFLDQPGEEGEPCVGSEIECAEGLVCIFEVCGVPRKLGEACDSVVQIREQRNVCAPWLWCVDDICVEAGDADQPCYFDFDDESYSYINVHPDAAEWSPLDYYDFEEVCGEGLRCIGMTCLEPSSELVTQPGSDKVWMRCPVGMEWNGWKCVNDADEFYYGGAISACPDGFELPSAENYLEILDHCEYDSFYKVYRCDICIESSACNSMFGHSRIASSTVNRYSYRTSDESGSVNFHNDLPEGAIVRTDGLNTNAKLPVLCIQK